MRKNYITRKEKILLSAIDLIDKNGIQGCTIREVANSQNVSEAAIYRHFKNKNDIIEEALNKFCTYDERIFGTISNSNFDFKEGIVFYTKAFTEYYENYPQISTLQFLYNSFKEDEVIKSKMESIHKSRIDFIDSFTEEKLGSNNYSVGNIIVSTIAGLTLSWKIANYAYSLKEIALNTAVVIAEGVLRRDGSEGSDN